MTSHRKNGILFGNASDTGKVREKNEDYFGQFIQGTRRLFAVADGMGGEAGGQEASRAAVMAVRAFFDQQSNLEPAQLLAGAVWEANRAVLELKQQHPELSSMGTTLELVLVDERKAWLAHVGDSRIYRFSGQNWEQLTRDHTRIQQMLDASLITPEEAADHPQRHVLSKVVGHQPDLEPDISSAHIELADGEALLMCSDGLSDLVSPAEMAWAINRYGPQRACQQMVRMANTRGGHDNATVQVIFAGPPLKFWQRTKTTLPPAKHSTNKTPPRSKSYILPILAVGCLVVFLLGAAVTLLGGRFLNSWLTELGMANKPVAAENDAQKRTASSNQKPVQEDKMAPSPSNEEIYGTAGKIQDTNPWKNKLGWDFVQIPITTNGPYMQTTAVTVDQWKAVMGNIPEGNDRGTKMPVVNVTIKDVKAFLEKLNRQTPGGYRLPKPEEWEWVYQHRNQKTAHEPRLNTKLKLPESVNEWILDEGPKGRRIALSKNGTIEQPKVQKGMYIGFRCVVDKIPNR